MPGPAGVDVLVHSFCIGELSFAALARVDLEKTRLGAKVQENLIPKIVGSAMMRPGSQYIGASASNNQARGIPFVRSVSLTYGLELTTGLLRIWTPDSLLTRASVTSTVTNGDFSSSTGWTLTTTGGGSADINSTVSGQLALNQVNRGGTALCKRSVTTSSAGTEHALRIEVTRGPVFFRCGSADGLDDYITSTNLDTGEHSLAFTPSGTYYVEFQAVSDHFAIVDSITVESAGVVTLTGPWSSEIREIQYAQSVDVMWLTHTNWQPRKVERRGATSWSLVKYSPNDGPFAQQTAVESSISVTPSAAHGSSIALTSSGSLFRSTDVGSLWRTNSGGFDSTFPLAAANATSEPIRVKGIGLGNKYTVSIGGTWSGTIQLQVSFDGPQGSFADYLEQAAFTTNGTTIIDPGTAYDNVLFWARLIMKTYVSGEADVQLIFGSQLGSGGFGFGGGPKPGIFAGSGVAGVPGIYRITGYSSATSVSADVLSPPSSVQATIDWQRGEWSDTRGWPRSVAFHDGRICFGRDDRMALSVSDNYYSFATEDVDDAGNPTVTDASSIQKNLAVSSMLPITHWMMSLQRLVVGMDGTGVSARSDAFDAPLTPTASSFKAYDTIGSNAVAPVRFDNSAFYISAAGDKMYQIQYEFQSQDYTSTDMTEMNEDIGNGGGSNGYTIVELAVQRKPQPYVWAVRSDGTLLLFLFSPKHQLAGWFRVTSLGSSGTDVIESVYVLPVSGGQDRVYMWVKRTISGSTFRYLEKFSLATEAIGGSTTKIADAGTFFAGPSSSVTAAQLANCTGLVAWGTTGGVSGPITGLSADGSGVISLGATYTNIWVGLPYTGKYQSSRLAYGAKNGTALLMNKRVPIIGLLASNLHKDALKYGPSFTALNSLLSKKHGATVAANTVHSTYEENPWPFNGSWDSDSRVCLQVAAGYPATLNGLVIGVETNQM